MAASTFVTISDKSISISLVFNLKLDGSLLKVKLIKLKNIKYYKRRIPIERETLTLYKLKIIL